MSNKYFLVLNVNKTDVINPSWVMPYTKILWKDAEYLKTVLTPDFFNKLNSVAPVSGAMIFNKINNQNPWEAHTDVYIQDGEARLYTQALNIVFDQSTDIKGTMKWYSNKNPSDTLDVKFTPLNTPITVQPISELIFEEETCIDEKVTLVRTDVPHIIVSGNNFRTCVSIRFKKNYEWETIVQILDQAFNQSDCNG